ncbi:hypothetical protein J1D01_16960, partial [Seonamhaeicola sp. NFXS20]|uniref:hypothetical protein n=1 Tax=Seonamhaeicola sp. NFXS20 TaxID=2816959 RepID=UPI003B8AC39A
WAIIHCYGFFLRKNPAFLLSSCYGGNNPADFFRNETIAKPLAIIMKKTLLLILLVFCFLNCANPYKYSKKEALVQSFHCLNIKQDLGAKSNLRNPYFLQLAKILKNDSIPDKSITDMITVLTVEIERTINDGKKLIDSLKPNHNDTRFFDATWEYLDLNKQLEAKNRLLVASLLNPKSDKNIEIELSNEVEELAQRILEEQTEYVNKESKFHNDNNIVQREVDSIVDIIKNK